MGDFPGASDIAKRLRAMVPPGALADDDPAIAAMQQHMQLQAHQAQQALQQMAQQLQEAKSAAGRNDERTVIEAYKAETERLSAIAPAITPDMLRPIFQQLMTEMLGQQQPPQAQAMPQQPQPQQPQGMSSWQ